MDDLKNFSPDELKTVEPSATTPSGSRHDRFVAECLSYYRELLDANVSRLNAGAIPANQAILFLYAEAPRVDLGIPGEGLDTTKKAYRSLHDIDNGLVVCNENLRTMIHAKPAFLDSNEAMGFIEGSLSDSHSFVLVLVGQYRMLVHDAGVSIQEWCENPKSIKVSVENEEITPDIIAKEIDIFHDEQTRTHRCFTSRFMWELSGNNYVLTTQPELRVQSGLVTHLRARFRNARAHVDEEAANPGGRTDIKISRNRKSAPQEPITTMIELKVLAPNRADQANLEWGLKGIAQADSYRLWNTDECFACIFDARRDKSNRMSDLDSSAATRNVRLGRYEMQPPEAKLESKKLAQEKTGKIRKPTTRRKASKG